MSDNNRNSPCHCGSGKKYKKCCLPKEQDHLKQKNAQEEKDFQEWSDTEWVDWFAKDCEEGIKKLAKNGEPLPE